MRDERVVAHFWSYVARGDDDACWSWTGQRVHNGYGSMYLDGIWQRASRVSYALHYGPIPPDLFVCHTCDNPPCVNPGHLWLGTRSDNMRDCISKERGRWDHVPPREPRPQPKGRARGERHGRAKLTQSDVLMIREARAQGMAIKDLAAQYGVSGTHISSIARGLSWQHVPDAAQSST